MSAKTLTAQQLLSEPFATVPEMIHAFALERPAHPAVIHGDRVITFAEFDALLDRIAATLQRDGFKRGDSLAVCASSSIEYAAIYIGALRAGVAVAPLAPSSTPESLVTMIVDSDARALFIDGTTANLFVTTRAHINARIIALD